MEKTIKLKTIEPTALLGVADAHIKLIETAIPATIIVRGETIKIRGEDPDIEHARIPVLNIEPQTTQHIERADDEEKNQVGDNFNHLFLFLQGYLGV